MNKAWEHFKLISKHKYYVLKNCRKAGITKQGLLHDLSKYSPTEFFESVKYFSGNRSPIDNCKDEKGYSMAWFHHRGRNKHHWEYWYDDFSDGGVAKQMPFKYALEMLCDYFGAGQAYEKKKWTYMSQLTWWNSKKNIVKMHPVVWNFINDCIITFARDGDKEFDYFHCMTKYNFYECLYKRGELK